MPKVKISEYSATANSNTDVASINIDEGCAPSGINNAIRAVMGHLKDFQQGTYGDPFNGPVNGTLGATTASTANVTTLTTSSTVTHNGGTENGVAFLNGSKVLTTGSALTFDGTTFGVGTGSLRIDATSNIYGKTDNTSFVSLYGGGAYNQGAGIGLGGASQATNPNVIIFTRGAYAETARFDASGNLGIGTTLPLGLLNIKGSNGQLVLNNGASSGGVRLSAFTNAGTANGYLAFEGYSSEYGRFDASGNLLLKTTSIGTSAAGVIGLGNATAPTSSPAGMGQLYVEGGALKYRGSSGTVTTIAAA
jgi:hypothetical protein